MPMADGIRFVVATVLLLVLFIVVPPRDGASFTLSGDETELPQGTDLNE